MRILIIDTCYPAFLRSHYRSAPSLAQSSYLEQWRALMDTFFGTADAYSHNLAALGHEAHEVVANCDTLQRAWARENGLPSAARPEEIVLAQMRQFRPNVVYVQNLAFPSDRFLADVRASGAFLVGQIASEAPGSARLHRFDLLLTSFPHFVDRFRGLGIDADYFRIGFDVRVLDRLAAEPIAATTGGAVFVGALNRTQHRAANAVLARAAKRAPIDFWGYGVRTWPPWSPIRRSYHGEAWGLEMYQILRGARIALNRHIAVSAGNANNMRLYEATGVGTMLLTDARDNLAELFEPGREVVTYADEDDLVERIRHYLAHDDERRAIARAGQERTLREHTYAVRMGELVSILEARL
jgi:hypothetical protein